MRALCKGAGVRHSNVAIGSPLATGAATGASAPFAGRHVSRFGSTRFTRPSDIVSPKTRRLVAITLRCFWPDPSL